MKNMLKYTVFIILAILLNTGCLNQNYENANENNELEESKPVQQKLTCVKKAEKNRAKFDLTYIVYYTGDYVDSIDTTEIVESDDLDYLKSFKKMIEKEYEPFNKLEYYDSSTIIEGNKLTSRVKADYRKIDVEELVKIDKSVANIMEDGKVLIENMKTIYEEQIGTTCDK